VSNSSLPEIGSGLAVADDLMRRLCGRPATDLAAASLGFKSDRGGIETDWTR